MAKSLNKLINIIPDAIKNASDWFLKSLDKNSQDIVDNASGTIGILLKIFGKPAVEMNLLKECFLELYLKK